MKKPFLVVLFLSAAALACETEGKVDRIRENGVEVVLNHIEPYRLPNQPASFDLEPVLEIDTEGREVSEAGMGEAGEFDVDGRGNIIIVAFKNQKDFIYLFNPQGRLINSFGQNGQGPGEIEWPFLDRVFDDGRIALTDRLRKYIVFDQEGKVTREFRPPFSISYVYPLDNGRYVIQKSGHYLKTEAGVSYRVSLFLCDSDFSEIKELDQYPTSTNEGNEKLSPFFLWRVSSGHIYVASQKRGYEILDYDFEGNLRRRIRKEYRPVSPTREIKESILGPNVDQPGVARYFPDPLPPLCALFVDDEGGLFVMTYEPGDREGEYLWDIFNADGVFIGRKSLDIFWLGLHFGSQYATVKNGLFYAYQEKDSGFRVLTVQKLIWK